MTAKKGWQCKNHSSYWSIIHPSFWESFDVRNIIKSFSEDLKSLITKQVLQKPEINSGFELFVLWFHQGPSWTTKVQLLFYPLLCVTLLSQGVPYYCITCTTFLAPEDRRELCCKASTFNDKKWRPILDFKKVYCTYKDLHLCTS